MSRRPNNSGAPSSPGSSLPLSRSLPTKTTNTFHRLRASTGYATSKGVASAPGRSTRILLHEAKGRRECATSKGAGVRGLTNGAPPLPPNNNPSPRFASHLNLLCSKRCNNNEAGVEVASGDFFPETPFYNLLLVSELIFRARHVACKGVLFPLRGTPDTGGSRPRPRPLSHTFPVTAGAAAATSTGEQRERRAERRR